MIVTASDTHGFKLFSSWSNLRRDRSRRKRSMIDPVMGSWVQVATK